MTTLKLIVAGGREFDNYKLLNGALNHLTKNVGAVIVVSGKARGADNLGERWAKEHGHIVEEYPADWDKYGKSAGYKRNALMAKNAGALVAFWDGKSKGTKHMIDLAKLHGLKVRTIRY